MKICPTCNKEFPDDQKFCKYDGTPLVEVEIRDCEKTKYFFRNHEMIETECKI